MPIFLTEDDVRRLVRTEDLIDPLEAAFQRRSEGQTLNHPRRRIRLPKGILHAMEAADLGLGRIAVKVYTSFKGGARFLAHLYDGETGDLLALMQGDNLGQMRTGATTGLAARWMAKKDATVLALFGAGWQAESQLEAVAVVRDLAEVRVHCRTESRRIDFAAKMSGRLGLPIRSVDSPESALDGADLVVTVTPSATPIFDGSLLQPGMQVTAAGSNALSRSELDVKSVTRAARVVLDDLEQAKLESGELFAAVESRCWRWELAVELSDVVAGRRPGRLNDSEITLFKSNGIALEDVVAASLVYDRAVELGVGVRVDGW